MLCGRSRACCSFRTGTTPRAGLNLYMSLAFSAEKQLAVAAVRRACLLTSSVFNKLVKNETLTKDDKSPVTGSLIHTSPPFT